MSSKITVDNNELEYYLRNDSMIVFYGYWVPRSNRYRISGKLFKMAENEWNCTINNFNPNMPYELRCRVEAKIAKAFNQRDMAEEIKRAAEGQVTFIHHIMDERELEAKKTLEQVKRIRRVLNQNYDEAITINLAPRAAYESLIVDGQTLSVSRRGIVYNLTFGLKEFKDITFPFLLKTKKKTYLVMLNADVE